MVLMVPASTVLIPLTGKKYEVTLCKLLRTAGYHVIEVGDNDCFDDHYDIISSSLTGTSTVIIDIENISCMSTIIRAAESSVRKPKIVLLTSLLTWCGEGIRKIITDPESDFCSRIPLHCARKSYDLENALWNAAFDSRPGDGNTYFVGIGLLYGGIGWDFESSLRRLWRSGNNSFSGRCEDQELSLLKGGGGYSISNNSLQIHCDDFFNTVLHLVDASCYLSPSYFPLVDDVPECTQRSQGPCNNSMQDDHLDRYQNIAGGGQVSWDPKCALLSSKLKFVNSSASLPERRCRNFLTIWKEFTECHGLVPFNMMFVGGPQCGQTETAKAVSKMLDLQYVDIADTLKWVLQSTLSRVASERASGVLGNREEPGRLLMDLVSAKIMEGSRKGSAIVTEVGLRSFVYTESFIQTLPSALQRKCVALRLGGCPKCQMKGYALDIWSTGHSLPALISNAQDFMEMFQSPLPHADSPLAHSDDSIAVSIRPILTLIEFQSDKKGTLQRITTKFTDGKGTKEQLIVLKALETRIESYTSRLQDVPDDIKFIDVGVRSPLVNPRSHEIVLDIMRQSSCRAFRICAEGESSVEGVAQLIADQLTLPAPHNVQHERETDFVNNRCNDEATVPALAASHHDLFESCPKGIIDEVKSQYLIIKINEGLVDLKVHESESLVTNCNELLQYLEVNVNPFVAKGLICIERTRPVDPIQFLVEALETQGRENRDHARAGALAEFERILKSTGSRT